MTDSDFMEIANVKIKSDKYLKDLIVQTLF